MILSEIDLNEAGNLGLVVAILDYEPLVFGDLLLFQLGDSLRVDEEDAALGDRELAGETEDGGVGVAA